MENNKKLIKATLNIFKALPIKDNNKTNVFESEFISKTIEDGFILDKSLILEYKNIKKIIKIIKSQIGLSPEEINSSFHKSWKKIKSSKIEKLISEQILHYFSTYGLKSVGLYDDNLIYIPNEKLDIPQIDMKFEFLLIKGLTKSELKEKIFKILKSGIALKESTMNDILVIIDFINLNENDLELIKNKEIKNILFEKFNIIPKDPIEFLRYVLIKITGNSLLIKDKKTIDLIKENLKSTYDLNYDDNYTKIKNHLKKLKLSNLFINLEKKIDIVKLNKEVNDLFIKYDEEVGFAKLSEIFYRFKPIFLALKTNTLLKPKINKIRKLAIKNHKPMLEDYLNTITSKLKNNIKIDIDKLKNELKKVNQFRKIRLAYALNFRINNPVSILYRIRNGKSYVKDYNNYNNKNQSIIKSIIKSFFGKKQNNIEEILKIVLSSIVTEMKKKINGKKIYIPKNINYTLPSSEKQFSGNFPSGTYISVPKDMIIGIHWENDINKVIDLDLSMININIGKIGWDSKIRNEEKSILFSGDMTSAPKPNGATELFYVKKQKENSMILISNYYNYDDEINVKFNLFVASEETKDLSLNYMVNPNNVLASIKSEMTKKQKILGILVSTTYQSRFYFVETNFSNSISSSNNPNVEKCRNYLLDYYKNSIELEKLLKLSGALIVTDKKNCDIDLSINSITKNTILDLIG